MKSYFYLTKHILLFGLFFISLNIIAQSQWRFPLCFEDATGARDTIWVLYDTTAHISTPVDTALGEGYQPLTSNIFNVYTINFNGNTTKTYAFPYSAFPGFDVYIDAINYQLPVTITWDTSLFHSPILPTTRFFNHVVLYNEYFFLVNNDVIEQAYNALITDSAYCPPFSWGSMNHFPLTFGSSFETGISPLSKSGFLLFPTISTGVYHLNANANEIKCIDIFNMQGELIKKIDSRYFRDNKSIDLTELPMGMYFLLFYNLKNDKFYEKIIKVD